MGIFKQIKDMKDMVNAAPALVEQAQQMGAQAQQMAAAQQAAAQARMAQFGGGQPGAFAH
jgi:phage-related minor tail protein